MTPRQSFSSHPRIRDAAALGFTSSLGPFAANGIMPGFHAMAEDFGVSFVAVQQSLTIYLFTYAFFSLVAGSFSDSYGRRPTFIGGMLLFAAASIGAAFSQSLWALYGWRLLQGIGAAVGSTVGGAGSTAGASGSVLPAQPASRHSAASSAKILRFIVYFPHLFARCVLLFAAFRGSFPDFTMPRAQTQAAAPRSASAFAPAANGKPLGSPCARGPNMIKYPQDPFVQKPSVSE